VSLRWALLRNPRHEKFSQLVASGIKPQEAYISVGYKPTGAKQAASRLLTNVDVRQRVSELQEAAARSTADSVILNRERVLNRLSQLSHEAQLRGQYSAATRCEELIGKEIGMFVDRRVEWDGDPNKLTDEQLQKFFTVLAGDLAGSQDPAAIEGMKRQLAIEAGVNPDDVLDAKYEPVINAAVTPAVEA
jgi:terminase small subunit-like protein